MALPVISKFLAHRDVQDVTASVAPEAIETIRPRSLDPCDCAGTAPVGYTVLEINHADAGSPATAVITEVAAPVTPGKLTHWRFVFLTDHAFGVGMALEYGAGWAQRAQYINSGNGGLCGKGLEAGQWVPSFGKAGAQVDMVVESVGSHVKAYIIVNMVPQGLAFDLDFSGRPDAIHELKPMVSSMGEAKGAKIAVVQMAYGNPGAAYKTRRIQVDPEHPTGQYRITSEVFPGVEFPPGRAVVSVRPGGKLSCHVFNTMNNGATLLAGGVIGNLNTAGAITTRMMPPPQFVAAEETVKNWMGDLKTWRFADNKLILNDKVFPLVEEAAVVSSNSLI